MLKTKEDMHPFILGNSLLINSSSVDGYSLAGPYQKLIKPWKGPFQVIVSKQKESLKKPISLYYESQSKTDTKSWIKLTLF